MSIGLSVSAGLTSVSCMFDRQAALLLLTGHLPQKHVPGSGTVFLTMSLLPHLHQHFGEN